MIPTFYFKAQMLFHIMHLLRLFSRTEFTLLRFFKFSSRNLYYNFKNHGDYSFGSRKNSLFQ